MDPGPKGDFRGKQYTWDAPGRSLAAVSEPSDTVMFADAGHSDGPGGQHDTWCTLMSTAARVSNGAEDWVTVIEARHNDVATIAWCDGHVKPMKLEAVYGRWDGKNLVPTQSPPDRFFDLQ